MEVKNYIRFIVAYFKLNLSTAMEYRMNFIVQVIFMALNNTLFILFWYFLFNYIDNVNGWGFESIMLLFAFGAMTYGILDFFFGNWKSLNTIIAEGSLDFYLTLPKNELLHSMISRSTFSGMGDILFAIGVFFLFAKVSLFNIGLFFLLSILATIVLFSINLLFQAMAFYFGNSEGISYSGLNFLLGVSTYPLSMFNNITKFILFFVIPVAFITNVPVMLLDNFSIKWLIGIILASVIIFIVSIIVYKIGLKKYESGNLVTIRV
ncbi:hypothetical protein EOM09_06785 [bacterium]|nr:hypothetical protein [bacterium]